MIFHCSRKLATRLPRVSAVPLTESGPLGSWHGHLFSMDRRQCVMFCHDATRYVLFLPGLRKAHFAELGDKWFRVLYLATLAALGCSAAQLGRVDSLLGPARFDTATDRSVQASLRVATQDLEAWVYQVPNVMHLDPLAMSCRLNERPVTVYGKLVWPVESMRELVSSL
jgi:hypothetical protein